MGPTDYHRGDPLGKFTGAPARAATVIAPVSSKNDRSTTIVLATG
jgi:hypothetical protein